MKKQRGLRKYFNKLQSKHEFDRFGSVDTGDVDFCINNHHLHFDYKGYGNSSFKKRKPHLDKLFWHFDYLVRRSASIKTDYKPYAIVLDFQSSSDALFFYQSNPSNDQFTFDFKNLSKKTTLKNKALNYYINDLMDYDKLYGKADEAFCLIFKNGVGQPF